MKRIENECVGCTSIGLHCIGSSCPNLNVPHWYCDNPECGCELDEIYDVDGEELCEECLKDRFRRKKL